MELELGNVWDPHWTCGGGYLQTGSYILLERSQFIYGFEFCQKMQKMFWEVVGASNWKPARSNWFLNCLTGCTLP